MKYNYKAALESVTEQATEVGLFENAFFLSTFQSYLQNVKYLQKIAKQIDAGTKKLVAPDWNGLRNLVVKILEVGKDRESSIKLVTDNKGEAKFPSFFCGLSKEGKPYVRNNFVGSKLAFTAYELTRMKNEQSANIKNTSSPKSEFDLVADSSAPSSDLDLGFDLDL